MTGAGDDATFEKFLAPKSRTAGPSGAPTRTAAPEGAWDPEYPVATYATHRKTLNVGGGKLLPLT